MPTGAGNEDTQGIWQYGEADSETLFSDLLNRGQSRQSEQFAADRVRLDDLEDATADTGDQVGSYATGWTTASTAKSRRKHGLVTNTGGWTPNASGSLTTTYITIGTLPAGMAPAATLMTGGSSNLAVVCQFQVTTTGLVQVRTIAPTTAYTTNTLFSIAGTTWAV